MADLTCHHGFRYGTCPDCGERPEQHISSDETGPAARRADTLRTLNGARAVIREACAALGCEPSTLASTALEARQRVAALEAEVAKLRRERDEARAGMEDARLQGIAYAAGYAIRYHDEPLAAIEALDAWGALSVEQLRRAGVDSFDLHPLKKHIWGELSNRAWLRHLDAKGGT